MEFLVLFLFGIFKLVDGLLIECCFVFGVIGFFKFSILESLRR